MIEAQSATAAGDPAESAIRLWRHVYGEGAGIVAIFTGRREGGGGKLEARNTQFYEYPDQLGDAISWALEESGRGRETSTTALTC